MIRVASTAMALLASAAACVVGPDGEFESLSGGTGGTGVGTTGDPFAPDPVACDPAPDCGGASDCCAANQPPVSLVPYACCSSRPSRSANSRIESPERAWPSRTARASATLHRRRLTYEVDARFGIAILVAAPRSLVYTPLVNGLRRARSSCTSPRRAT